MAKDSLPPSFVSVLEIGSLKLKVATPEDLIIMKAVAQRPRDIADIESILNAERGLDLARIRRWTQEFASVLGMPEIHEGVERLFRHKLRQD
jgi:predicted nucleotidyltransferase